MRAVILLAALAPMSFSYQLGNNPAIDYVRALVSDTQSTNHIFEDEEITMFSKVASGVWQSSQFYSGQAGQGVLPTNPVNYLRTAAYALNALAANKARLASIKQLLDVRLDSSDASIQLRDTAQMYLDMDDNMMSFVIIEQVNNPLDFRDRFWKQVQRQLGI